LILRSFAFLVDKLVHSFLELSDLLASEFRFKQFFHHLFVFIVDLSVLELVLFFICEYFTVLAQELRLPLFELGRAHNSSQLLDFCVDGFTLG